MPHAFARESEGGRELVDLVWARITGAPPHLTGRLRFALRLLDTAAVRLVFAGTTRPWHRMTLEERSNRFARLGLAGVRSLRAIYETVRRLILSTWYGMPDGRTDIGVLPPLHLRKPTVAWEGPVTTDGGPVVATAPRSELVPRASPARVTEDAVTSGSTLSGHLEFRADVVVIGSGAGGSVAAARLAEAGREVVILESGPWLTAVDFDEDEGRLLPLVLADGGLRATNDASISLLQGAVAGGGTTINWMLMLRTPEFVVDDWRRRLGLDFATTATMSALHDLVERETGAGFVPDEAHSPANCAILRGAAALGWRARPAMINARGCVRAGTCTLGCRYGAKQGALMTSLPRAFAAGARLFANTRAERIRVLERSVAGATKPLKAVDAVALDESGRTQATLTIEAPVVVVAGGAVETPVLLKRSGIGGAAVGRYLTLHPTTAVMGEYAENTYPLAGIPQTTLCDEFLSPPDREYGFWIEVPALGASMAAAAIPGFGADHLSAMKAIHHTVPFIALVRDGADVGQSNGSVGVNAGGAPVVRYRLARRDAVTLRAALEATA
ncbi:MAG: GMC family oxidoreductase N-terminal domain-containing protein, partial [Gemmatimonadota bacterium]